MIGVLLKNHTKVLHDSVEEKLRSQRIMDRSYALKEYHLLLRYNFLFLLEFEEAVFSKLSAETNHSLHSEKRRKLPLIEKDLSFFEELAPPKKNTAPIKNEAEALGILYVMEGATLGGSIIAKNLKKNVSFEKITLNYFGAYGSETGMLWKNFQEVIEEKSHFYPAEDFLEGAKSAYQFLLDL